MARNPYPFPILDNTSEYLMHMNETIISRYAPTPSGYLHLGNASNFMLVWMLTRAKAGKIRLRIDDLDSPRVSTEFLDDVFETLHWLGLDWDEGPKNIKEHNEIYSQSLRVDRYKDMLNILLQKDALYACHCSRKQLAELRLNGLYCPCRKKSAYVHNLTAYTPLRLFIPEGITIIIDDISGESVSVDLRQEIPDPIIWRRDGLPAYHLASLTDDFDFGTNLIVRGMDLLPSTALQKYLASLLELTVYDKIIYHHHQLQLDGQGQKLSKTSGSLSLQAMRRKGMDASSVKELIVQSNCIKPTLGF